MCAPMLELDSFFLAFSLNIFPDLKCQRYAVEHTARGLGLIEQLTSFAGAKSSARYPSTSFLSDSAPALSNATAASPEISQSAASDLICPTYQNQQTTHKRRLTMSFGNRMMQRRIPGIIRRIQRAPRL